MGNIHSYCCPDVSDETEDEQEEQSRFLSESASNTQQYGACEPPKPPSVYKIVLPKLIPIEIHELHENHETEGPAVIKEEYCSEQFEQLRSLIFKNPDDQSKFRQLLWSCIPWSAPGGKSGSTFLKTRNDQFILKEMSKLELQSFLSIANEYFNYIESSYNDNKLSLLSTIFGIYRIVYTSQPGQTGVEYYFMVMKNLFYKRNISQRFDLKGSVRNRLTDTSDPENNEHVLMDENLLRIACDHPLFIHARSKQILNECIENDSSFLSKIGVMDYSLLVGVDKENQELVLGIIDYVRPFTWDKKIRTCR
uniref:1-phosphatidylinositol 3-phosphate 5-kinase n=1 Tax=Aceria tosichella TaxID=561515 RepID=A0A6G1SIQ8_9ACAR